MKYTQSQVNYWGENALKNKLEHSDWHRNNYNSQANNLQISKWQHENAHDFLEAAILLFFKHNSLWLSKNIFDYHSGYFFSIEKLQVLGTLFSLWYIYLIFLNIIRVPCTHSRSGFAVKEKHLWTSISSYILQEMIEWNIPRLTKLTNESVSLEK